VGFPGNATFWQRLEQREFLGTFAVSVKSACGLESADLLSRRMDALDLDESEVARVERATFQDLQRVCSMCDCKKRCARDLARDAADSVWKDYCPNARTLTALDALPWSGRQEW
jgi:hypothetical protein